MTHMRKFLFIALAATAPAVAAEPAPAAPAGSRDPRPIVERMLRAYGGADAPYGIASLAFTFAVEREGKVAGSRRHCWHPQTGDHALSRETQDEADAAVTHKEFVDWNLHTREGIAIRDGVELEGEALEAALTAAEQMWINDTYWLLMPYKLLDPGVRLAYDGELTEDGRTFDRIRVTFDSVGLTPGDTYWAFIARDNARMERWSFVLEGREPPATEWDWTDYAHYGPLLLPARKLRVGAEMAILTDHIVVR